MIVLHNPVQFQDFKNLALKDLIDEVIEVQKDHIRKTFDKARLDSTAQACIEMAETLGFDELAAEMESDLVLERIMSVMINID